MLQEKRLLTILFEFKKFTIKQAIFIIDIMSIYIKAAKQKKIPVFFSYLLKFLHVAHTQNGHKP